MKLVIVESPAKAKTIQKYLGSDFEVESSIGHIRDLPRNASEIPAKVKGEKWSHLGVDVDHGFAPIYIVPKEKKEQVKLLKAALAKADELYLATDGDREGEAIAWHLIEVLKPKITTKRMVFHEITKEAVTHALKNSRDLDEKLVAAQESRRVLDRLYGYELSPVLWKKVRPKLSAGRVQSVATRIVVERERERISFTSASYWNLLGTFAKGDTTFTAKLYTLDGTRIAGSRDFDKHGALTSPESIVLDEDAAKKLDEQFSGRDATVAEIARKPYRRSPMPPFRTSTLQQAASSRLGFSASRTMAAAQRLYEAGLITYMRTDSTTLSKDSVETARAIAAARYGKDSVSDKPRSYANKVKNAQEAHEAIRPAGSLTPPDELGDKISGDTAKVYDLIWRRTIASQMADARGETVSINLKVDSSDKRTGIFQTSGTTITHPGFRHLYGSAEKEEDQKLPSLNQGDLAPLLSIETSSHETKPPSRYSEASLIKRLEELGIGRPSTYASIMSTIQNRGYVEKQGSALVPTFTAFATTQLLEQYFPHLVDYQFTAEMEEHLDEIARGEEEPQKWLERFYFGEGKHPGLHEHIEATVEKIDAKLINSIPIGVDANGVPIVARAGKYSAYIQRGDENASIPDGVAPDEITVAKAEELFAAEGEEHVIGDDPKTGTSIQLKNGRYGYYVQLGDVEEGSKEKPKRASLFSTMDPKNISLEDAVKLLSLPREIGEDPETHEPITSQNGPYGPYLKRGTDNRSLETEDQIFAVTLEEAIELFKQPKRRRGQKAAAKLKELGEDPNSKKPIVIKTGRYGPYITDGETNVSLKRGEESENITSEDAIDRLAEKRAKGPVTKKKRVVKKKK